MAILSDKIKIALSHASEIFNNSAVDELHNFNIAKSDNTCTI